MHHPLYTKNDDSNSFSTIFGDLVFGLLFVFFLLAIALVFNKPEQGAFASEVKSLEKALQEEEAKLKELKAEHQEVQKQLEQTRKQIQKKDQSIASLEKRKQRLENQIAKRTKIFKKRLDRLNRKIKKRSKRNQGLSKSINNLLDSQAKNINMLKRELARQRNIRAAMTKDIQQLKKQNQNLGKDIQKARRVTAELDAIMGTLKRMLDKGGYPDILAEVKAAEEQVKEEREKRREEEQQDEDKILDLKVMAVYWLDDQSFQVQVLQGSSVLESYEALYLDPLCDLCKRVMKTYEEIASGYSKEDKRKHRPRMHLTMPPETPYSQVEDILNKLKKIIPVTITS